MLDAFGVPLVRCSAAWWTETCRRTAPTLTGSVEEGDKRFTEVAPETKRRIDPALATPDQIVTLARSRRTSRAGPGGPRRTAAAGGDRIGRGRIVALIAKGADVDRRSRQGDAACDHRGARAGHRSRRFSARSGRRPRSDRRRGWNLLHTPSCAITSRPCGFWPSAAPTSPPARRATVTPLALAVSEGKYWAAEALIQSGAPVDERYRA